MEHNQRERLLYGADNKPNNAARRMFHVAPLDVAHISASGLQAGESAQVWMRVGSGNPQTSGGAGANTAGVDYGWTPLAVGGHACTLTPESNSVLIAVPGTYSIGAPSVEPTFAGDVNIEHHKLDHNYIDMAVAMKAAAIGAASAGDGVVASGTYDTATGNLVLTNTVGGTVTINVPGVPDVLTTLGLAGTDLTYTDEEGNSTVLDLSALLDDTNLSRIVSGALDAGVLTLTRDDSSSFDVDLSALIETVTTLVDNGDETFTYTSEDGAQTTFSVADVVTTLVDNGDGTLTYTSEDGTQTTVDTNDTITTLVDNTDGTFTYTSEDGTQTTLDLSDAAMVGATATVDGAQGDVPQPAAGEEDYVLHGDATWRPLPSCPDPMTRAELLALRSAGSLEVGCHYTITDYDRGTVGTARITLHASAPDELGMEALVSTGFDDVSWEGRYDVGANRIVELADNVGNTVSGQEIVDVFPWGNASLTDNNIHEAAVFDYTGGTVRDCEVTSGGRFTQSAGSAVQVAVNTGGDFRNAGANANQITVSENAVASFAAGSHIHVSVSSSYTLTQLGSRNIRYCSFEGNYQFTVGEVALSDVHVRNSAVNTTGSTGSISRTTFDVTASAALTNVPNLTVLGCSFEGQSQVSVAGADTIALRYNHASGGGRILASAGTSLTLQYTNIDSYGYVQCLNGTMVANYCNAQSLGYIRHNSPNANSFDRVDVSSQSNARIEGTADGCRMYYSSAQSGGTLLIDGASVGAYMHYCQSGALSTVRILASVDTRMYYCSAAARGTVLVQNDPAQTLMYYCHASSSGTVHSLANVGAATRIYSCNADSQSILRLQNSTGNSFLYYSSVTAYYYLLLTLQNLTRFALHGYGRRTYTVTDPATNGTFVQNF